MQKIQKKFLGHTFTYSTHVNQKTSHALWNENIDKEFSLWLHDLKIKNRELFKIQYSLSSNAYDVLNKLKEKIGIYDDSLLVRAMTITFINYIDTREGQSILKKLEKETENFNILQAGETLKKNLYFSPVGLRDVEAYANLTGLKKCNVVQNSLYSVLLISIAQNKDIHHFWEQEILTKLTTIAKAA